MRPGEEMHWEGCSDHSRAVLSVLPCACHWRFSGCLMMGLLFWDGKLQPE